MAARVCLTCSLRSTLQTPQALVLVFLIIATLTCCCSFALGWGNLDLDAVKTLKEQVAAATETKEQKGEWRKVFPTLATNKDGSVDEKEWKTVRGPVLPCFTKPRH